MAEMKFLLALLAVSCVLAEGKLHYKHDEKVCSKPNAEKDHPFCNWHYLVYAPRIFRAGTNAKVLVSTHNIDFDVNVTTALMKKGSGKVFSSSNNIIKPGGLTQVNLKVPFGSERSWYFQVNGTADVPKGTNGIPEDATWTFSNRTNRRHSAHISIKKPSSHRVLIQTDRPIYKPGETIRIRVLSIDSNLKAVSGVISKVAVLNPSRTTMRQWRNEKLSGGFASFKLKLSIKPVLGLWRVKASVNGKQAIVYINVAKYVLPKFKVTIKPPSYIAYGQTKVDGEICAKYSYGKDVSGQLKAKICATHPRFYDYRRRTYNREAVICEDIVKKVSGCIPFEIDLMFFMLYKSTHVSYITPTFTIEASVKESATAITLNATKVKIEVKTSYVQLSFDGTPAIFKPGLPFEAWVHAKRPNGDPVDNIKVEVKIRDGKYKRWHRQDVSIKRGKGKVIFSNVLFNAKNLQLQARYTRKKVAAHGDMNHWRTSDAYHTASAWYSPTHSYISITKPDKVYKPGTDATFNVKYTATDSQKTSRNVFYALMCKGNVAASGSFSTEFAGTAENSGTESPILEDDDNDDYEVQPLDAESSEIKKPESTTTGAPPTTIPMPPTTIPMPYHYWERRQATRPPLPKGLSVGSFNFSFPVTQDMTPSCRMLVYYIKDRETVADSLVIQTGNSFANKVSMKFSEKQVFPGTKVNLTLKASPGSRFAISAVDKSVHFLRKANDLKSGQVLGLFKELDIGPSDLSYYDRCGFSYWYQTKNDFVDSQKAFNDNGMTFLSNLFIDTRPCNMEPMPIYYTLEERIPTFAATAMPQIFTTGGPRPDGGLDCTFECIGSIACM